MRTLGPNHIVGPELELRPHDSEALILPQQACQLQAVWEKSNNRVSFQKALRIPPPPGMQLKFCIVIGSCRGASLLAGSEFKGSSKHKKNGYCSFPEMMLVTLLLEVHLVLPITSTQALPLLASSSLAFLLTQACLLLHGWPAGSNNKDLCELPFIPHTRVTPLTVGKAQ